MEELRHDGPKEPGHVEWERVLVRVGRQQEACELSQQLGPRVRGPAEVDIARRTGLHKCTNAQQVAGRGEGQPAGGSEPWECN